MEEANFFPQIAEYTGEPDIMQRNIEQHRAFDAGLTTFDEYIYKLKPEKYDGAELKRLLEGFAKVLVVHLSEEIETLLGLQKYGGEKLGPIFKNFNDNVLKEVKDKVRSLLSLSPPLHHQIWVIITDHRYSIVYFHVSLDALTEPSRTERMPTFPPFRSSYPTW